MSATNKAIIDRVNAAFASSNMEAFYALCDDDLVWTMVGDRSVRGKAAIREWMNTMDPGTPAFTVDEMIAEGDSVAAHGKMTMKDKDGAVGHFQFCDIYRLRQGRVVELTSFVVKTPV
jgi:ketosteroid isomerase-like protein